MDLLLLDQDCQKRLIFCDSLLIMMSANLFFTFERYDLGPTYWAAYMFSDLPSAYKVDCLYTFQGQSEALGSRAMEYALAAYS